MRIKKLIIFLLTIILCATILCACENKKSEDVSTKDEATISTKDEVVEATEVGLIAKNAEVDVIPYNAEFKDKFETPTDIGACVFTILTSKENNSVTAESVFDETSLREIMKKYSDVLNEDVFNITYSDKTKELEYFVCDFITTYTFGSNVEMYMISSPLFDKNISYLIENVVYDKTEKCMYVFLKNGWNYHEEAHTEEDEKILKNAVKKANGATVLFFNELNENMNPKKYIFIMPK